MPGSVLDTSQVLIHSILETAVGGRYYKHLRYPEGPRHNLNVVTQLVNSRGRVGSQGVWCQNSAVNHEAKINLKPVSTIILITSHSKGLILYVNTIHT